MTLEIIIALLFLFVDTNCQEVEKKCNIYNDHFRGKYLYAGPRIGFYSANVLSYGTLSIFGDNEVYDRAEKGTFKFDDKSEAVWDFIQVANMPNTYYIRSSNTGDYLYASNNHNEPWSFRRYVYLRINSKGKFSEVTNNNIYMWEIKGQFVSQNPKYDNPSYEPKYTIWNLAYNQALYTANQWFNSKHIGASNRKVFTWHKAPDSDKFNWIIKCSDPKGLNVKGVN